MMNRMTPSAGAAVVAAFLLMGCSTGGEVTHPTVTLETTEGIIQIELYETVAPASTGNFLQSVESGFYDGLIFHRVMPGFMVQGGGFEGDLVEKAPVVESITNESNNGQSNLRGTVAMARTGNPHSARAQFYVNHADNLFLDYGQGAGEWGYAVFGKVIEGMDVVDSIASQPTAVVIPGIHDNVPIEPIVITSARRGDDVPSSLVTD